MRIRSTGLGSLFLVLLAGSALGQEAPAPPEKRPPPLKGPEVRENRAPHVDDQFTDGMRPQGRMGPQIPMRAYAEVISKLRGDQAPDGVRLSEDQDQKIGAIEQEFRETSRAHAQQMREQRGEDQPRRPGNAPEGKPGEPQRPRREAMQDMMKNGPRPGDYQTRIWAVLNEKQQAFVKVELDKVRDDLQKRRGEEAMQRRIAQKDGKPGSPQAVGAGGPEGDARPMRERAMRIVRRMSQMPEEDRDRMLRRIEEELDRRGIPDAPDEGKNQPPPPRRPRPPQ